MSTVICSPRPGAHGYASGVPDLRLGRLRESAWLRAGLLVVAAGLAVYGLVSQWTEVQVALDRLDAADVVGATVSAVVAALGCMLLAWRALLADLGSPLPLPAAIRVMFVGQLGKYVPGAVWALAAQVSLARDYDVPRRRSGTASLVSMAITLVVGLIMAGRDAAAGSRRTRSGSTGGCCVHRGARSPVCLYPPVTKFGLDLALRVLRRPALEGSVSRGGMARALGWTTLGWLCYGAARLAADRRHRGQEGAHACCCRSAATRWPGRSASCSSRSRAGSGPVRSR